jgi:hypothetical protein
MDNEAAAAAAMQNNGERAAGTAQMNNEAAATATMQSNGKNTQKLASPPAYALLKRHLMQKGIFLLHAIAIMQQCNAICIAV